MKQAPELIWLALPLLAAVGLCSCSLINPLIGAAISLLTCLIVQAILNARARHARQFIRF